MKKQKQIKIRAFLLCFALMCLTGCEKTPEQERMSSPTAEPKTEAPTAEPKTEAPTAEPKTEATTTKETTASEAITQGATEVYISPYNEEYGSAGTLAGTTVVVSIVTNDRNTHWGFTKAGDKDAEKDRAELLRQKNYLLSGCEWLVQQAAAYNLTADFIADWEIYPDLYYEYDTTEKLVRFDGDKYFDQKAFIQDNIPSEELKKKYRADSIIYIFFFNTNWENEVNPWSVGTISGPIYDLEFINAYTRFQSLSMMPCTYAHEMMHCFGAYDLSYENNGISQEYVDHLMEIGSQDIMFCSYDCEEILVDMGPLDAYYIGLTDLCEDVVEWNLVEAERFR